MTENIEHVLEETRSFEAPEEFAARAHLKSRAEYDELYAKSIEDPDAFWGEIA